MAKVGVVASGGGSVEQDRGTAAASTVRHS